MDLTQQGQPMEDPIAEALARRGGGQQAPMMDQGMAQPMPQAPQGPQMPPTAPPMQGQGKQEFMPKDGHELVLTTLAEQLKNDHKLEMEKLKMNSPQQAPMI